MDEPLAVEAQIVAIQAVVNREGGATVGCDELRLLCPDHMSVANSSRASQTSPAAMVGALRFCRMALFDSAVALLAVDFGRLLFWALYRRPRVSGLWTQAR